VLKVISLRLTLLPRQPNDPLASPGLNRLMTPKSVSLGIQPPKCPRFSNMQATTWEEPRAWEGPVVTNKSLLRAAKPRL
jgi:hypothetical protein